MAWKPQEVDTTTAVEDLPKPKFLDSPENIKINERIAKAIVDQLGVLKDFLRVEVKYLYPNRYRANVLVQRYLHSYDLFPSISRPLSYFVKDVDGKLEFDPPVRKQD